MWTNDKEKKKSNSGLGSVGDWKRWRHPALNDTFPTNKWMCPQWNTRRVIDPHSMTQCLPLVSIGRSWEGMGTISISYLSPWCSVKVLQKSNEISLRGGTSAILGHIASSVIYLCSIYTPEFISKHCNETVASWDFHAQWLTRMTTICITVSKDTWKVCIAIIPHWLYETRTLPCIHGFKDKQSCFLAYKIHQASHFLSLNLMVPATI